jgi:putative membrane protein insertion efficiency factor
MNEHDPSHEADCQTCDPELSDLPKRLSNLPRLLILLVIKAYQKTVSNNFAAEYLSVLSTCSHYTYQAVYKYGAVKGGWMGVKRIVRCNPFNPGGFDPVP